MTTEITPQVRTFEDQFPKRLGPPPVPNYQGGKILGATKPTYTVELDAGAFRAVWEHMEAEARHRYPTHQAMGAAQAYLRAIEAFRATWWATHEPPPDPEQADKPPVRKLNRRPR